MHKLSFLLPLVALAACTRPDQVRQVAVASEPVLAGVQRSGAALQRQFILQRENLAVSTARYERIRRDAAAEVRSTEAEWADTDSEGPPKRLAALREQDSTLLADPLTALRPETVVVAPPSPLELKGLIVAAKTLGRLKSDSGLTGKDLFDFLGEVDGELRKLESEQEKQSQEGQPATPSAGGGAG